MIEAKKEKRTLKKLGKLAKEQNIWRNLEKNNLQKRDSNPQPTKTEHFGNIGPNSAGEPVLVSGPHFFAGYVCDIK